MSRKKAEVVLIFVISLACLVCSIGVSGEDSVSRDATSSQEQKRLITVADAIGMTKVADRVQSDLAGNIAQISPDGKKCVVLLRKGNLERNTNDYSLLLWDARTLFTSTTPPDVIV